MLMLMLMHTLITRVLILSSSVDLALEAEAKLLVRFLHPGVTAAEVRETFAQHGPLASSCA